MRPVETLIGGFVTFLLIITTISYKWIPDVHVTLTVYILLLIALFSLIYLRKKKNNTILEMTCDIAFPVMAIILIFNSLGGIIQYIRPVTYDHILIQLDYRIFNAHPTVLLERFTNPVITEVLQLAYTSYYFMPIILGIALKIKGGEKTEFERSIFLIILCFFLSYIGYFLIPAIGPRFTLNHIQNIDLQGILLRDIIDSTLNSLEITKRDAFPSGHTAVTLVVLYLTYNYLKRLFWIFLPFVFGLLIATVYLRYHYVVDVIAGVLLFIITMYTGDKYYTWWEKRYRNTRDA